MGYECDVCHRKSPSISKLKDHKKQVHTKVTCEICEEVQYNWFYLKRHKASIFNKFGTNRQAIALRQYKRKFQCLLVCRIVSFTMELNHLCLHFSFSALSFFHLPFH